jgi:3-hydroxyisobutyrate dehydrogenase-like beta-hydroxyacid dehydrogenase
MIRIGVLHPGSMGISLAVSAQATGHEVCWASAGRSTDTTQRAETHGLTDLRALKELCSQCGAIISICPPVASEQVARDVAQHGFDGVYLDANAISPQRAQTIADIIHAGGGRFVDGGIVGGPAWKPDKTFLHLSGPHAGEVVPWFAGGLLETNVLGDGTTQASALKMCFAAYTKGTAALFYGILATSEALGVRDALVHQWSRGPELAGQLAERAGKGAGGVTSRAWRWIDEMQEISRTFEDAGVPGGFHAAAAEIFRRIECLRDEQDPDTDTVVAAMLRSE